METSGKRKLNKAELLDIRATAMAWTCALRILLENNFTGPSEQVERSRAFFENQCQQEAARAGRLVAALTTRQQLEATASELANSE